MSNTQPHPGDMKAAFTGLILGAVALFAILYGIVHWTNGKYAGHGEKPAAEATH